jgi:hypothetical protein
MNDNFKDLFQTLEQTITKIVELKVQQELASRLAQATPKKQFYNLKELAEISGITFLGLKGRIKRGNIKATKDGNTVLVSAKEVERLLNSLRYKMSA